MGDDVQRPTNGPELTRFRLEEMETRLGRIEAALDGFARMSLLVEQVAAEIAENRKTLRGLWVSVIVGVILLVVTTIAAKIF